MKCSKCASPLPDGAVYCPSCGKKQLSTPAKKALKRPNGAGTVYKLPGRRRRPWAVVKNKVYIGYYETKTAALAALESLSGQRVTDRLNMTFSQVFEAWKLEHYPTVTKSGALSYDRAYDVFQPLHSRKFRDLRTADFQQALAPHMGKTHSTVAKYKQLITQMSQWAIREELITTNFASFVRLPEQVKQEKEIFTQQEIEKLHQDGSEAAMVVLCLIYTGLRIGELFSVRVEDFHGAYLIGGEKTDAGRNRIVPIRPEGRPCFAHFAANATDELLISGYAGQKVAANFRRREYYPLLKRLGIRPLNPHCTRHTFASWAVSAGVKPELLQKMLGHADYSTTANIYTHADVDQLVRAVEL